MIHLLKWEKSYGGSPVVCRGFGLVSIAAFALGANVAQATIIVPPGQRPLEGAIPSTEPDFSGRETPEERLERMYDYGIRKRPAPPPSADYLSVVRRDLVKKGVLPNLPPMLRFGMGFGSWFALQESAGRQAIPGGSHNVSIQLLAFDEDRDAGRYQVYRRSRYATLDLHAISFGGQTNIPGSDSDGLPISFQIENTDLDVGFLGNWFWLFPGHQIGHYHFALQLGYLPFRFRQMIAFGRATPQDEEFTTSGFMFNLPGALVGLQVGYTVASTLGGAIFAEMIGGFPEEIRLRAGLSLILQDARMMPSQPQLPVDGQTHRGRPESDRSAPQRSPLDPPSSDESRNPTGARSQQEKSWRKTK